MQSTSKSKVKDTESFVYTISSGEVFSIIEPVLLVKPSQLSLCGHAQINNQCDFSHCQSRKIRSNIGRFLNFARKFPIRFSWQESGKAYSTRIHQQSNDQNWLPDDTAFVLIGCLIPKIILTRKNFPQLRGIIQTPAVKVVPIYRTGLTYGGINDYGSYLTAPFLQPFYLKRRRCSRFVSPTPYNPAFWPHFRTNFPHFSSKNILRIRFLNLSLSRQKEERSFLNLNKQTLFNRFRTLTDFDTQKLPVAGSVFPCRDIFPSDMRACAEVRSRTTVRLGELYPRIPFPRSFRFWRSVYPDGKSENNVRPSFP